MGFPGSRGDLRAGGATAEAASPNIGLIAGGNRYHGNRGVWGLGITVGNYVKPMLLPHGGGGPWPRAPSRAWAPLDKTGLRLSPHLAPGQWGKVLGGARQLPVGGARQQGFPITLTDTRLLFNHPYSEYSSLSPSSLLLFV